jgi:nicotinate-nucleotide pyrophosphorylase (carboxylating)
VSDAHFPVLEALRVVATALEEDLGPDGVDVTTMATVPADQEATGLVVAREDGVVAGLPVVDLVMASVSARFGLPAAAVALEAPEGSLLERGDVLARVVGPAQVLLVGERTMLNVLGRLSGVATHTRLWASELRGTGAMVLDTRKTTPGLRALEKYAVRVGGGTNKRMGLYDVAMVKDNHKVAAGGLTAAYLAIRERFPEVPIQVEVTTTEEALEAVRAGARFLLCDNMATDLLAATVQAVRATGEAVEIEATGGLTLEVARAYAETGVDYLSVGGLTHSSPVVDIAMDLVG